jgi:hypothetical protein
MAGDSQGETAACKEFQERLQELLQRGEELYDDPHLQGCDFCRRLVVELEVIADAARRHFGR